MAGATLIAGHMPGPIGINLLHAAHEAYAVGMTDVLRVSAVVMIAGALLIGTFMPADTKAAARQRNARRPTGCVARTVRGAGGRNCWRESPSSASIVADRSGSRGARHLDRDASGGAALRANSRRVWLCRKARLMKEVLA